MKSYILGQLPDLKTYISSYLKIHVFVTQFSVMQMSPSSVVISVFSRAVLQQTVRMRVSRNKESWSLVSMV